MRVGIVTFHCSYNYGSVLQTWALKSSIERMGNEVFIVDYRGDDFKKYKLLQAKSPRTLASSLVFYWKNKKSKDSFEHFISEHFDLTERYGAGEESRMESELSKCFDCFVCGSDQIWNLDCSHGPVGAYFLSFAGGARRVAYAPSLSHISFEKQNFGSRERRLISEWLSHFYAVSVRETATAPIFQGLCPMPIDTCLDPTLLLDADDYGSIISDVSSAKEALFVYMLERNPQLMAYAHKLVEKTGMPVLYVSRRDIDFGVSSYNLYGTGPSEFVGAIRDCAAVLTNSFHATVFSLLFGKPFQTFATARGGERMRDLLTKLGEADHLVDGSIVSEPVAVPVELVKERLSILRRSSLEFLEHALE